jgi:spermidine synthase
MKTYSRSFYLGIIFCIGFVGLVYQIYSVKVLFMFFIENTYAVATAISSFLAGIACSSLLFSRLARQNTRNLQLVCWMMLAGGAYGFLILSNYHWIPQWLEAIDHVIAMPWLAMAVKYGIMWFYLFLPAFFLGGAFPLINGLCLDSLEESAPETGTVYFWDTLGAIAGALVAGFVLLPMLGLRMTVMTGATINLWLAVLLMPRRFFTLVAAIAAMGITAWDVHYYLHNPDLHFTVTQAGYAVPVTDTRSPDLDARFGHVIFQKESPYGRVTVGSSGPTTYLFLNYRGMCQEQEGARKGEGTFQPISTIARLVQPLLAPGSEVLDIGLGCGFTASELAFSKNTKHVDIVEINPVIVEASRYFSNRGVLSAPNVNLHIMNGADWLLNVEKRYDSIIIDIEEPSVLYSSPLYTRDYFRIMSSRLRDKGVLGFWSFVVTPEFCRVMYNTLKSVFPYVAMRHYANEQAILYYASMHPFDLVTGDLPLNEDQGFLETVLAIHNDDVNTIENRALEKYVNMNKLFDLPSNYKEGSVR